MKVIGLTGGIGTGKSTVAQFLAELGAAVIDVDKVGHQVLTANPDVFRKLVAAFDSRILTRNGDIDRRKLGAAVFERPEARVRLNKIIHPAMKKTVTAQIAAHRRQGTDLVVLDAPLLLDAGWQKMTDEVWVTAAPEATVLERLQKRSGLSAREARARISSQLPAGERLKHADVIVDTNVSLESLKAAVEKLWQETRR